MDASEAGGEAGQLQPLDAPLVAEGRPGDAAGRTALPAQPHLPADTTDPDSGRVSAGRQPGTDKAMQGRDIVASETL